MVLMDKPEIYVIKPENVSRETLTTKMYIFDFDLPDDFVKHNYLDYLRISLELFLRDVSLVWIHLNSKNDDVNECVLEQLRAMRIVWEVVE